MKITNINSYTNNLTEKDGIFFSNNTNEISYPADGNDIYFSLEDNSFWFKHRNNCIIGLAKKYVKDKLFFDIGGGNGFVSKGLEDNGILTCLIEPNIQGCLNAKKRGLTNIICSDLENVGFEEGSIHSVGLFDVIEHVENDVNFLSKINKLLMSDGVIIITVPSYNFLWSEEDVDAGHFRRYSSKNMKAVLNESGFETVFYTYLFSFLVPPILLFRTLPSLLRIYKSGIHKKNKEHRTNKEGIISKLLELLLSYEVKQIEKNRKILFGSSCLFLAKKK